MDARLGQILLDRGVIDAAQLETVLRAQNGSGEDLERALVSRGIVTEKAMIEALATDQNLRVVSLDDLTVPPEVLQKVPAKFAWHYKIMPLTICENVLTVAISDPFNTWPVDDLETNLGYRVEKVMAVPSEILDTIQRHYGVAADTIERILAEESSQPAGAMGAGHQIEDLERLAGTASVIRVVNQVLQQAIGERATDIHLETFRDDARLRYRVDGILRDTHVTGDIRYLYPAIVSRIKIMAGLDIIERRLPQDGRAKVCIGTDEYDLRVSIMPTIYGENVVVRILPTTMLLSMADLGLGDADLSTVHRLIQYANGIIFVTGPTGSGKSTTLYAALKQLNGNERKLVTIEDPVEYELRGVSQVQVNPKIGLTFARALRSMLRHDPDVIMVGEIRDFETANIATQAALTGHLVLSTLHTNDAASAVTRLLDIGIEPFLLTSSVRAFIAQRLIRVLCPECREPTELDARTLADFADVGAVAASAWQAGGCKACEGTGYRGRTGIYEILRINETIRDLILQKQSADAIRKAAVAAGMTTLKQDGLTKILAGITTTAEVLRVCQVED